MAWLLFGLIANPLIEALVTPWWQSQLLFKSMLLCAVVGRAAGIVTIMAGAGVAHVMIRRLRPVTEKGCNVPFPVMTVIASTAIGPAVAYLWVGPFGAIRRSVALRQFCEASGLTYLLPGHRSLTDLALLSFRDTWQVIPKGAVYAALIGAIIGTGFAISQRKRWGNFFPVVSVITGGVGGLLSISVWYIYAVCQTAAGRVGVWELSVLPARIGFIVSTTTVALGLTLVGSSQFRNRLRVQPLALFWTCCCAISWQVSLDAVRATVESSPSARVGVLLFATSDITIDAAVKSLLLWLLGVVWLGIELSRDRISVKNWQRKLTIVLALLAPVILWIVPITEIADFLSDAMIHKHFDVNAPCVH